MTDVKTTIATITPEQAAKMLEKNAQNRTLKPKRVASIVRDLNAGRWQFNGDCIRFDPEGWLIDGQHRLWACVNSGVSIRTIVVRGLSNSVRRTIDSGAKRTIGDRFQMDGVPNYNAVGAAINILFQIANRDNRGVMTPTEADDVLKIHPGIVGSVTHCSRVFPLINPRLGALHYIGRYIGHAPLADDFIDVWRTGIPSYKGDAAHVAREKILRMRGTVNVIATAVMSRMVLQSFNLFLAQKSVKSIRIPDHYLIRGWHLESLFSPAEETIASLAA